MFTYYKSRLILNKEGNMKILNEAQAHCDIPCGIYDPISAKISVRLY